jgi:hypothetical protein
MDDGNAQASFDISANLQVCLLPFASQLCCKSFSKSFCFMTKQTVSGAHKRSKVYFLLRCNRFRRITVALQFSISIGHSDVYNAIGSTSPEATQNDVSSVVFAGGLCVGLGGWTSIKFFNIATWANQGFVTIDKNVR